MDEGDELEATVIDEEDAAQEEVGGNTLLDSLRRAREEAGSAERYDDFPIPGYHGRLFVRVRFNPNLWDKFKKLAIRVEKSRDRRKELYAHADQIVLATEQIMVLGPDDELHPLGVAFPEYVRDASEREEPLSFADRTLDRIFDLKRLDGSVLAEEEDRTARESCLLLINNPLAVTQLSNEVAEWLQGSSEDDEAFLGEFSGAQR